MPPISQAKLDKIAQETGQRIEARREQLGLTLEGLARRMRTNAGQVHRLIHGQRRLTLRWLYRFSDALECSVDLLIRGDEFLEVTIPVVGYVGAGAQVFNFDDRGDLDRVVPPPGAEQTVSVVVQGDSMVPRYWPGQHLFFKPAQGVGEDCIGRPCIVQVYDGPTLVKIVQRGAAGLYRLVSVNRPEVDDVELVWAARVLWTKEP